MMDQIGEQNSFIVNVDFYCVFYSVNGKYIFDFISISIFLGNYDTSKSI
jgi:hypothetical protein